MLDVQTGLPLMRCKHCKHAEDTAKIWETKCSSGRHSFTEPYEPLTA